MRKKILLGTLIVVSVLMVSCIPTVLATPDVPLGPCFVATDENDDPRTNEHTYFDEYTYPKMDVEEHEQVWYKEDRPPGEPYPISEDNEWIDTEVICSAEVSSDNVILTVETIGIDSGTSHSNEILTWTIINGAGKGYFTVTVAWYKWTMFGPMPCEEDEDIDPYQPPKTFELDFAQALDLEFLFEITGDSPGQKEYWVVTEDVGGDSNQWFTVQQQNPMNGRSSGVLDQVWYTDKHGPSVPIWTYEYHINTKCLVWAETVNTNDARIHVQTYGESNYYPEMINWTITGGAAWIDEYFNLDVDVNGTHKWDTNVYLDADPQLEIIGPIDNLDVEITYYGTDPDP